MRRNPTEPSRRYGPIGLEAERRQCYTNVAQRNGGEKGMAVLKDMNDLEAGHDEFLKSLAKSYSVAGNHWQTYK